LTADIDSKVIGMNRSHVRIMVNGYVNASFNKRAGEWVGGG